MWLVVVPASSLIAEDESERTQVVGRIARVFGRMTNPILVPQARRAFYLDAQSLW